MIIFFETGRLGNQIFQYCAMRKFQPDGAILAIGMNDLKTCFSGIKFLNKTWIGVSLEKVIRRAGETKLLMLARWRLISLVEEVNNEGKIDFQVKRGLLGGVYYFKGGYYQSETIPQEDLTDSIRVADAHISEARRFLFSLHQSPQNCYFVHIRRGDYVRWPSLEAPAVIPSHWYREQMQRIRESDRNAFFILISDDHPYVEEIFFQEPDSVIHKGSLNLDFAIMTQCHGGGVLSASSYSWWGAYFVNKVNPKALLIAPQYWVGHPSRTWYPSSIQTNWLQYSEVMPLSAKHSI